MDRLCSDFIFMHRWVGNPDHPVKERQTDGSTLTHGNFLLIENTIGFTRYTVCAFDGESNYSIQLGFGQGGSCDALIVEANVDSPIKSEYIDGRFKDEGKFIRAWLDRMPVGLREKVVSIIAGKPRYGHLGEVVQQISEGIAKPQMIRWG